VKFPGFSQCSNPGLQLANAFGVLANAFGVLANAFGVLANAFGVSFKLRHYRNNRTSTATPGATRLCISTGLSVRMAAELNRNYCFTHRATSRLASPLTSR